MSELTRSYQIIQKKLNINMPLATFSQHYCYKNQCMYKFRQKKPIRLSDTNSTVANNEC